MTRISITLFGFLLLAFAIKSLPTTQMLRSTEFPDSIRYMMQVRVKEMLQIRQWIVNHPDSALPFKPTYFHFSSGIPSDSDFLTPTFFILDTLFHREYATLYQKPSAEQFNKVISVCEACHNTWCPGPLRLIKKFYLASQAN